MDLTMEEARSLVSDASLWPRIRDFLWDFAPSIHRTWFETLDVGAPKAGGPEEEGRPQPGAKPLDLLRSNLNSPRARRFVLDGLGVEPCFHAFPKDDWSRLLLLDGATLLDVAKWLGSLACADSLRLVTGGSAVRGLKAALAGVYPEVFGYTAYFRRLKAEGVKADDPEEITRVGAAMLLSVVAGLSAPLRRRFLLKLPRDIQPSGVQTPDLQPSNLQLLLKLRFPEAYTLCCS